MTGGKLLNVPHFDGKAEIEDYIKSIGVPATFLEAGPYMSNLKIQLQKVKLLSIQSVQSCVTSPLTNNCRRRMAQAQCPCPSPGTSQYLSTMQGPTPASSLPESSPSMVLSLSGSASSAQQTGTPQMRLSVHIRRLRDRPQTMRTFLTKPTRGSSQNTSGKKCWRLTC